MYELINLFLVTRAAKPNDCIVTSHRNRWINQEIHAPRLLPLRNPDLLLSRAHQLPPLLLLLLSGLAAVPIAAAAAGDALPFPLPKQWFWVSFLDFWVSSLLDSFRGTEMESPVRSRLRSRFQQLG
ncbi:hypothetical protein Droror1_Dr00019401 [Drosera rotundifolia]